MKIIDEELLDRVRRGQTIMANAFAGQEPADTMPCRLWSGKENALKDRSGQEGACLWCRRRADRLDPAHIIATGMGGGRRLDHPWNVVPLCRECHNDHHQGQRPLPCDLLLMVAHREGVLQEDVERELYRILQLPRSSYSSPMLAEKSPRKKRRRPARKTRKSSGK